MARHDPIPDGDDVARWIKPKLMSADDNGEVEVDGDGRPAFIFPQAFALREGEEYLSLTWVDHFGPQRMDNIRLAAAAVRESQASKRLSLNGAFAVGAAGQLKACCNDNGHRVRVLEEPLEANTGHVAVRRYPTELGELQEELANEIFLERHFYRDLT